MAAKKRVGRPNLPDTVDTVVVAVRIPAPVYDAYVLRATRRKVPVRRLLRQTLVANVRRDDVVDTRQSRSLALAILLAADEMDRANDVPGP